MNRTAKTVVAGLVVVGVIALLGLVYASPYIALDRVKRAADARDAETVNRYVDFPALRESLKEQVGELLTRRIEVQKSGNPLAVIGAMIGAALVGPLVDSYATPEGVAAILNGIPPRGDPGETPPPVGSVGNAPVGNASVGSAPVGSAPGAPAASPAPTPVPAPTPAPATSTAGTSAPAQNPPQTTAGYRSFDTFVVTYQHGAGDARYSAIFRRSGLINWKLVAVDLNG